MKIVKLRNFIDTVRGCDEGKGIWIKNESFDQIMKTADSVRLNEKGFLVLTFANKNGITKIQISLKEALYHDQTTYFAEVKSVNLLDKYTKIVKETIYTAHDHENDFVFF